MISVEVNSMILMSISSKQRINGWTPQIGHLHAIVNNERANWFDNEHIGSIDENGLVEAGRDKGEIEQGNRRVN